MYMTTLSFQYQPYLDPQLWRDQCKKQQAFEELRMTSHWPHKPKLNPIEPHTYGNPIPNTVGFTHPELTDLGAKLAGF